MQQLPTLNKCCMEMEGVRVLNGVNLSFMGKCKG